MGFLTEGDTLPWEEAKKWANYIREHGIVQFLNIYRRNRSRTNENLLWGDEVRLLFMKPSRSDTPERGRQKKQFLAISSRLSFVPIAPLLSPQRASAFPLCMTKTLTTSSARFQVEYLVVKLDKAAREAKLALTGDQAVDRLDALDRANPGCVAPLLTWCYGNRAVRSP